MYKKKLKRMIINAQFSAEQELYVIRVPSIPTEHVPTN